MAAKMELHGAVTGNCLRAAIALEESGIAYTVTPVDLLKGEQRKEAHLTLNPAGKVPTLVERGVDAAFALSQSNAIILFAAEQKPDRLLPQESRARSLTLERFFYFVTDVIAVSHAAFALRAAENSKEAASYLRHKALDALLATQRFVLEQPFMAGGRYTIADIAGYTIAHSMGSEIEWNRFPALRAWFDEIGRRPGVQRGMHAFDEPPAG